MMRSRPRWRLRLATAGVVLVGLAAPAAAQAACEGQDTCTERFSARGTLVEPDRPDLPAEFSAATSCNSALSTRPIILRLTGRAADQTFRKTLVTDSQCHTTDAPASPTNPWFQHGQARGTLGEPPGQGLLQWDITDFGSGPDQVRLILWSTFGTEFLEVFRTEPQTPGPLGGTPGGVWSFPPLFGL